MADLRRETDAAAKTRAGQCRIRAIVTHTNAKSF
jgi:hypothetical protein